MDDIQTATGSSSISQHEKNIVMLFDSLKELKMSTEDRSDASVYSEVESECQVPMFLLFKQNEKKTKRL